jgi:hypothetical protein
MTTQREVKVAKAEEKPKVNGKHREKPIIRLDRLKLREHAHNVWFTVAPAGMTPDDLGTPSVWSAVASQFNRSEGMDLVRVYFEEHNVWSEVLIRQAVAGRATVVVLRSVTLPALDAAAEDALPPNHEIFHTQADGWVVRRISDDVVLGRGREKGWHSRQDAVTYLLSHSSVRQTNPGHRYS